jgi:hypothetical protein
VSKRKYIGYHHDFFSCDGLDNNCNNIVDLDIANFPLSSKQDGVCVGSVRICNGTHFIDPNFNLIAGNLYPIIFHAIYHVDFYYSI